MKKKIFFTKNILIRKEHFGTLILLRNGLRFVVDNKLFVIFKFLNKNNCWPKDKSIDVSIVRELENNGIITNNKVETGNIKFVKNAFVSKDCLSFPRTVYWECTTKCNYNCIHCYSSSNISNINGLPFSKVKKLINELSKKGTEFLSIGGGEPVLYLHIYKTIKYAAEKGLTIEMTSNGSLLNQVVRENLKKSGLKFLQISLDGITSETYSRIRRGGNLDLVLSNIVPASKEFVLSLCTVVNKINIDEIPKIINYSKKIGAKHYRVLPLMSVGRGKNIESFQLSGVEWRKLNAYLQVRKGREKKLNIQLNENLVLPKQKNIEWLPINHFGCSAGRTTCSIDAFGNIFPCSFMELPLLNCGNILKNNLAYIWKNSKVLKEIRELDHVNGRCGKCKHLSVCRGGCRAAAYSKNDKLDDSDYLCSVDIV